MHNLSTKRCIEILNDPDHKKQDAVYYCDSCEMLLYVMEDIEENGNFFLLQINDTVEGEKANDEKEKK